jgi:hypothetical protein
MTSDFAKRYSTREELLERQEGLAEQKGLAEEIQAMLNLRLPHFEGHFKLPFSSPAYIEPKSSEPKGKRAKTDSTGTTGQTKPQRRTRTASLGP